MGLTRGARMQGDVTSLLRARNTLLWIVTTEEVRVERAIIEAAASASYDVRIQDCWAGVTDAKGSSVAPGQGGRDPQEALRSMFASEDRQVWIFRDLHKWLSDPVTLRAVRNCAKGLQSAPRNSARSMVVICPDSNVPPELAGHTVVLEWPRPDREEIGSILDDILKSLPEELRSKAAPNGTRDAAIDAAVGLTAEEAASCYAKSLVQSKTIDPLVVAAEKKRVVGKLLEWHDPLPGGLDSVGGNEELKDWLRMMRSAYGAKARAKGINPPKGVLLVGVPGCIAEGTSLWYRRGKRPSGRRILIEDFCDKFNKIPSSKTNWRVASPTYLQSWDSSTGKIVFNEVTSVIDSGYKECIRVTTKNGSVTLTDDHPILFENGNFVKAGDLRIGDKLLVRGSMMPTSSGRKRSYLDRIIVEGLKYHPTAHRKVVVDRGKRYEYQRTAKARLVYEARMNNLAYEELLRILKEDPDKSEELAFLPGDVDVHHIDGDSMNDAIENLMVCNHSEHQVLHGMTDNFGVEHTTLDEVVDVRYIGVLRTFDISMTSPNENFVVNDGIIVHNCGKSLTAKAVATAWGFPLLRFDVGATKSKYVGESERNFREALRIAETVAPCVLWLN